MVPVSRPKLAILYFFYVACGIVLTIALPLARHLHTELYVDGERLSSLSTVGQQRALTEPDSRVEARTSFMLAGRMLLPLDP